MVLKPDWYTGRKNSRHIFEHHYVMCQHLGLTKIPRGWCVHHCNRCKTDNRIENLILMTISDHMKFHSGDNATTISKESTAKWLETYGTPWSDDIV